MENTIKATVPDNVAAAIQSRSTTPLPRLLLELAAIKAREAGLIAEHVVRGPRCDYRGPRSERGSSPLADFG